ncbi:MAG: hypothetical protein HYY76_20515 [Acidobacteria bacterium]|nr:hypothetical protein [Acidobacteriota bacterium]
MNPRTFDGGSQAGEGGRLERQPLPEHERAHLGERPEKRQRDLRDVAFLAAHARPERDVDERLDVPRLGQQLERRLIRVLRREHRPVQLQMLRHVGATPRATA